MLTPTYTLTLLAGTVIHNSQGVLALALGLVFYRIVGLRHLEGGRRSGEGKKGQ